eukprot:44260-Eustigmatos_ZCMA.PRE.1
MLSASVPTPGNCLPVFVDHACKQVPQHVPFSQCAGVIGCMSADLTCWYQRKEPHQASTLCFPSTAHAIAKSGRCHRVSMR